MLARKHISLRSYQKLCHCMPEANLLMAVSPPFFSQSLSLSIHEGERVRDRGEASHLGESRGNRNCPVPNRVRRS
jgi:hypothetical protein